MSNTDYCRMHTKIQIELPMSKASVFAESLHNYAALTRPSMRSFIVPGVFRLDNVVAVTSVLSKFPEPIFNHGDAFGRPGNLVIAPEEKTLISFECIQMVEINV